MDPTGQGKVFKVVRMFDPAVRWSEGPKDGHTDLIAYMTKREYGSIVEIEGEKAMVFHTLRLRRSQTQAVASLGSDPDQRAAAFALGVTQVDMPDGSTARPARERWTTEELDAFEFADVEDIGSVILRRSAVPLALSPSFVAPPSSVAASGALLFRSAARSQGGAPGGSPPPAAP